MADLLKVADQDTVKTAKNYHQKLRTFVEIRRISEKMKKIFLNQLYKKKE